MKLVSFFSGAGGLDLGFKKAGFEVVWANEYDKSIWETFEKNHRKTYLDKRSITNIPSNEIPECDGIIGGPPCQSWSAAGAKRGINDSRGKLFFDFIRVIEDKNPKFFLAENVAGMLTEKNSYALKNIKELFENAGSGYNLSFKLLNAKNYNVPQDRKRVFFIGFRKDLKEKFTFPNESQKLISLRDAIYDLRETATEAYDKYGSNKQSCAIPNHEYLNIDYSPIYMSRNRVRNWDEQSFTIQAGGRHAPIHPQAPKMILIDKDKRIFDPSCIELYRRLSVRECARIQTFPDSFNFYYDNILNGYKMIGNAVPVNLAYSIAKKIKAYKL